MAEIETRVAVIENNLEKMGSFFDRLDTTMEKLTEVSSSIKELLAVHELKINQNDDRTAHLLQQMEARREQIESKIALSEKGTKSELELVETKLTLSIDNVHAEMVKIKMFNERNKYALLISSFLFAFILWKIKVIPFIAPYVN